MTWNPSTDYSVPITLEFFGFGIDLPSEKPIFFMRRRVPDCRKKLLRVAEYCYRRIYLRLMSPALQYLRRPKLPIALRQGSPCFSPKSHFFVSIGCAFGLSNKQRPHNIDQDVSHDYEIDEDE